MATTTVDQPTVDALMTLIKQQTALIENMSERLAKVESATAKKKVVTKARLTPYKADFTLGVTQMVFQQLKPTDNKVVFSLICKDVQPDKEGYQRNPVFSFTLRQFVAFMETYKNCANGDLITLNDTKHCTNRFYCTKGTETKWIGE